MGKNHDSTRYAKWGPSGRQGAPRRCSTKTVSGISFGIWTSARTGLTGISRTPAFSLMPACFASGMSRAAPAPCRHRCATSCCRHRLSRSPDGPCPMTHGPRPPPTLCCGRFPAGSTNVPGRTGASTAAGSYQCLEMPQQVLSRNAVRFSAGGTSIFFRVSPPRHPIPEGACRSGRGDVLPGTGRYRRPGKSRWLRCSTAPGPL